MNLHYAEKNEEASQIWPKAQVKGRDHSIVQSNTKPTWCSSILHLLSKSILSPYTLDQMVHKCLWKQKRCKRNILADLGSQKKAKEQPDGALFEAKTKSDIL